MYSAQITRANPTCIVLLIDQSASMSDPFSGDSARKKSEVVAEVVNHTLHDLVIRCTKTEEVRNYYHIAVMGYGRQVWTGFGGPLMSREVVPISEVADHPLQIKNSYKRVSDGAAGWVEIPVRYPVWIHPTADGKTPMCEALTRVKQILERWLTAHPKGFPPNVCCRTDSRARCSRSRARCRAASWPRPRSSACRPSPARADLFSTATRLRSYSFMKSAPASPA